MDIISGVTTPPYNAETSGMLTPESSVEERFGSLYCSTKASSKEMVPTSVSSAIDEAVLKSILLEKGSLNSFCTSTAIAASSFERGELGPITSGTFELTDSKAT